MFDVHFWRSRALRDLLGGSLCAVRHASLCVDQQRSSHVRVAQTLVCLCVCARFACSAADKLHYRCSDARLICEWQVNAIISTRFYKCHIDKSNAIEYERNTTKCGRPKLAARAQARVCCPEAFVGSRTTVHFDTLSINRTEWGAFNGRMCCAVRQPRIGRENRHQCVSAGRRRRTSCKRATCVLFNLFVGRRVQKRHRFMFIFVSIVANCASSACERCGLYGGVRSATVSHDFVCA